jgi:hypothetical protein
MAGRWRTRRRCRAKTRKGRPCVAKALPNGRCRHHSGLSTGPRTEADMRCWRSIATRCKARGQPRNCGGVGLLRVTSTIDIPGVGAQRGVHRRLGTRRAERQQGFDRRRAALRCRPFAEPAGRRPRAVDAACRPTASRTGGTRATALPSWCDFAQHNELHSFSPHRRADVPARSSCRSSAPCRRGLSLRRPSNDPRRPPCAHRLKRL